MFKLNNEDFYNEAIFSAIANGIAYKNSKKELDSFNKNPNQYKNDLIISSKKEYDKDYDIYKKELNRQKRISTLEYEKMLKNNDLYNDWLEYKKNKWDKTKNEYENRLIFEYQYDDNSYSHQKYSKSEYDYYNNSTIDSLKKDLEDKVTRNKKLRNKAIAKTVRNGLILGGLATGGILLNKREKRKKK